MSWWHYLLLVNFYLVLYFGFYVLLLRRETFFQLNRIYLVGASLLSFFIPLMQADWVKELFITQKIQSTIYSGTAIGYTITFLPEQDVLTIGEILNTLYTGVTTFLVLRLCWQLLILKKAIEKPEPSAAYSFFKKISMGKDAMQHDIIAEHEQVHAKQWHSLDVMIIETVMIINWFNPVVYFYRFAIKYIHEYIADRQVIQAGTDKAEYALLLLSQTFDVDTHTLATPFFNRSLLKQRIMMLQKNRSQRIALAKYGLSAPLFALMLIFTSATVNDSKVVTVIHNKAEAVMDKAATEAVAVIADKVEKPLTNAENLISPTLLDEFRAEVPEVKADTDKVFTKVDTPPSFPGGFPKFYEYLANSVRYPKEEKEQNIQEKVFISFVVELDGTLSDIKAIRGANANLVAEAVRVVQGSPKWIPGSQNGKPVKVQYTVPIDFKLSEPAKTGGLIFSPIDNPPSFPGGMEKFYKFLAENIKYPAAMKEKNIEGKVYLSFMVETNGKLTEIKVIREPGNYGAGEEAVRVMKLSPRWMPGIKNNGPVRASYTLPIQFALSKPENSNSKDVKNLNAVSIVGYRASDKPTTAITFRSLPATTSAGPLYIVDGKVLDVTKGDESPLKTIPQESIERMEILKDETATKLYGDRGKYGVILVTTKEGAKANKPLSIQFREQAAVSNEALILIDGATKTKNDLDALDPKDILSIDVLKDESATKLYGEKGKNGVVKVTTKNAKK